MRVLNLQPPEPPAQPAPFKANILLVEDVQSDVFLTRISLDNASVPYGLNIVKYGREVVPYLQTAKPIPDLLLLDMNLPDMDGFAILNAIAQIPELSRLPIVILSGIAQLEDFSKKYPLNIIASLRKPLEPQSMRGILATMAAAHQ